MERNILDLTSKAVKRAWLHLVMGLALGVALCMGPHFAVAQEPAEDERPAVTAPSPQSPVPAPEDGDNEDEEGETVESEEDAFSDDLYSY